VESALPTSVRDAIDSHADEPVVDDDFEGVEVVVAADVITAIEGVRAEGDRRGLRLAASDAIFAGEARIEGPRFVDDARRRCAALGLDGWIAGGETTVTVRGTGRGGRGSEAALAIASRDTPIDGTFVAIATDGIDGSSEAAAVWVDQGTRSQAESLALDPHALLANNDSHAYFSAIGAQLVTGPTGTNVADVWIWIARNDPPP
jgi:hydroxypyruvate reductase